MPSNFESQARTVICREALALGLEPADADSCFGLDRGFPIALTLKESLPAVDLQSSERLPGSAVLLIQIRHGSLPEQLPNPGQVTLPQDWADLIRQGKASLSLDASIAWLVHYDASLVTEGRIAAAVTAVIDALVRHGGAPPPDHCDACGTSRLTGLLFENGRVVRKCDVCRRHPVSPTKEPASPAVAMSLAMMCPVAVAIASIAWTAIWIGAQLFSEWAFNSERKIIPIPAILEMAAAALASLMVAGAIVYAVRRCAGRQYDGRRLGLYCCTTAIVLGEVLFWKWLLNRGTDGVSWAVVMRNLPRLWIADGAHSVFRALIAGMAVYFSYALLEPQRPK